jgi:hypothetical protein
MPKKLERMIAGNGTGKLPAFSPRSFQEKRGAKFFARWGFSRL